MTDNEIIDIDVVVLWVDGTDPEWQIEKAKYRTNKEDDSNAVNRFRDWGLMPYWFRAIEQFLPWVRTVHFVTCGHVPEWLDLDCPKLHHVRHEDYLPKEVLPTFNANAIEMNIHRIPGLAEHFIFFNDDMFVIRPLLKMSFFKNGLPCSYGAEIPVGFLGRQGIWQHLIVNDMRIINNHFSKKEQVVKFGNKYANAAYRWQDNVRTKAMEKMFPEYFTGFQNLHAPAAFLKSTFEELWDNEAEVLSNTTANRFRTPDDVNQWLAVWWQLANGQFSPSLVDNVVEDVTEASVDDLCSIITSKSHDMICVNDPTDDIDFEKLSVKLKSAFETLLPKKSIFEK